MQVQIKIIGAEVCTFCYFILFFCCLPIYRSILNIFLSPSTRPQKCGKKARRGRPRDVGVHKEAIRIILEGGDDGTARGSGLLPRRGDCVDVHCFVTPGSTARLTAPFSNRYSVIGRSYEDISLNISCQHVSVYFASWVPCLPNPK